MQAFGFEFGMFSLEETSPLLIACSNQNSYDNKAGTT